MLVLAALFTALFVTTCGIDAVNVDFEEPGQPGVMAYQAAKTYGIAGNDKRAPLPKAKKGDVECVLPVVRLGLARR
ncbi:MAG: hypothetical protein AAF221_08155 [Pseudomonadota bacterium]